MIILFFILVMTVLIFVLHVYLKPSKLNIEGTHFLITGGSSGIGKALAEEVIRQGGRVTIVARNQNKLKETATELLQHTRGKTRQSVEYVACDVSRSFDEVEKAVEEAESQQGPVDVLINCAGISAAKTFENTPIEEFERLMRVNYLGGVYMTRAVLPKMKARCGPGKRAGRIVFVSSQAGQLGVFGYTAYSSTKFALRGLAEALQMEVKPYNIYLTVAYPPDTDTPGFREEMEADKPEETKLISATSGLFEADAVARQIIADTLSGHHLSYNGLDGWMLANLTCGMSPATSVVQVLTQLFLMGILRTISLFYLLSFDRIVNKCKRDREAKDKVQ